MALFADGGDEFIGVDLEIKGGVNRSSCLGVEDSVTCFESDMAYMSEQSNSNTIPSSNRMPKKLQNLPPHGHYLYQHQAHDYGIGSGKTNRMVSR